MRRYFETHAARGISDLGRQANDLHFVIQLIGDDFDNLANRELPIIAAIVDLRGGRIRWSTASSTP